jgi:DNA gyrase subunit A
MITCKSGVTIRMPVSGISEQGRATQGVKVIRLDDGDEIAAITKLDDQQGQNGNGEEPEIQPGNVDDKATQPDENPSTDDNNA